MSSGDLSESQQEAILNFQAITENEDPTTARSYLEKNAWDVSAAVSEFLAFSAMGDFSAAQDSSPMQMPENYGMGMDVPITEPRHARREPHVERLVDPRAHGQDPTFSDGLTAIGARVSSSIKSLWNSYAPSFLTQKQQSVSATTFVNNFQQIAGPDVLIPNFLTDLFEDILAKALETKLPLLVYINSANQPERFFREVMCNELIVSLLNENFVLWGVDGTSQEGNLAVQNLQIQRLPCIAVIAVVVQNQPNVIEMCDGHPTVEEFVQFIERNLNHFEFLRENPHQQLPVRGPARPVDPQIEQDRLLRQQQEREFREMEAEMAQREEQKRIEEEENARVAAEEAAKEEEKRLEREALLASLGDEPEAGPDITQIAFRLSDGSKITRRFNKTAPISVLYVFLTAEHFKEDKDLTLTTTYPTKELTDRNASIEAEGLHPQALLHVRENIDD